MKKYSLDQIENMSLENISSWIAEVRSTLSLDFVPRKDRAYISPSILLRAIGKSAYKLARELERQDSENGAPIA